VESPPDPEVTKAIQENQVVIGSQKERVSMLETALSRKGFPSAAHYDLPSSSITASALGIQEPNRVSQPAQPTTPYNPQPDDEGGLHL